MSDHAHSPGGHEPKSGGFWTSATGLVTIAFLAVGAFFLLSEHRAHLLGWLPWLLLAACLLLHFFLHGGHGGSDGGRPDSQADTERRGTRS